MIDNITQKNPCLLYNYDRSMYLANSAALELASLTNKKLEGMKLNKNGIPTGLIYRGSPALTEIRKVMKEKSHQRLINENLAALKRLRESGIVEIHDIARPEQTNRFIEIEDNNKLTCRVWLRPDLSRGAEMKKNGFTMGLHPKTKQKNSYLRFGALKGYIDGIMGTHGALFYEPYDDQP